MDERLPEAVWTGTLRLLGVELRTAVLDDGKRVIHAEDMERLFARMGEPGVAMSKQDIANYRTFMLGR